MCFLKPFKMKNVFYSLILLTTILLSSCTPDTPVDTSTSSPFTLKYEIISSSQIFSTTSSNQHVIFTNATQQPQIDSIPSGSILWTKELTVTTSNRPFISLLEVPFSALKLNMQGTVTGNIYVNGIKVASVTNPTSTGENWINLVMGHEIN